MNGTVVVAGGASMGSSVAAHLLADPAFQGRVVVVEKDASYRMAASALSAASIRQQYSQAVNIRLSLHGLAFLKDPARFLPGAAPSPVDLAEQGYLYLAGTAQGEADLQELNALQRSEGADIGLQDRQALQARFPWLATDDIRLGSLGLSGEGWFDGWSLLTLLRGAAKALGATYLTDAVIGIETEGPQVVGVRLRDGGAIACDALVNCAGSGGPALAALAGIELPVQAKRRTVFSFTARPLPACPLLIDTTGVWMRPDGRPEADRQTFIAGWSPPAGDDPDWFDDGDESQAIDWHLFEAVVWPALAARIPALSDLRLGRAWTGPYDMNLLDHNAIVGPAASMPNLFLCNGFSGHGLQHSPGIGRALSELIVHGRYRTIDLTALGHDRIVSGRPILERNVI